MAVWTDRPLVVRQHLQLRRQFLQCLAYADTWLIPVWSVFTRTGTILSAWLHSKLRHCWISNTDLKGWRNIEDILVFYCEDTSDSKGRQCAFPWPLAFSPVIHVPIRCNHHPCVRSAPAFTLRHSSPSDCKGAHNLSITLPFSRHPSSQWNVKRETLDIVSRARARMLRLKLLWAPTVWIVATSPLNLLSIEILNCSYE